jgi:hypothetical protein
VLAVLASVACVCAALPVFWLSPLIGRPSDSPDWLFQAVARFWIRRFHAEASVDRVDLAFSPLGMESVDLSTSRPGLSPRAPGKCWAGRRRHIAGMGLAKDDVPPGSMTWQALVGGAGILTLLNCLFNKSE